MLSIHKERAIWRLSFRRYLSEMVDNEQLGTFAAARATSTRHIGFNYKQRFMVTKILALSIGLFTFQCRGQGRKDLVYGGITEKQIVSAIRFSKSDSKGEFIKVDNMGNGNPFATVISYDRIESVASIRAEDTIRVSLSTFDCLLRILLSDSLVLKRSMMTSCGTFRFVLHNHDQTMVYYTDGYRASRGYFERLQERFHGCNDEKEALRIASIVWAFNIGTIRECK